MHTGIDYATLAETLLRGGIAPGRVVRLVEELKDHHADLFAAALARNSSRAQASAEADVELGQQEDIARELLARPELASWAARWPWLFYALLPAAALLAAVVAGISVLIGMFQLAQWAGDDMQQVPVWLATAAAGLRAVVMYASPIAFGAAISRSALRRGSRWIWPVSGIVAVALLGSTFSIGIDWGADLTASTISATVGWVWPYPLALDAVVRIPLNLMLVLVPYLYFYRRPGLPAIAAGAASPPLH